MKDLTCNIPCVPWESSASPILPMTRRMMYVISAGSMETSQRATIGLSRISFSLRLNSITKASCRKWFNNGLTTKLFMIFGRLELESLHTFLWIGLSQKYISSELHVNEARRTIVVFGTENTRITCQFFGESFKGD